MCLPSVRSRKTRPGRIPTSRSSGHYVPYNELLCLNLNSSVMFGKCTSHRMKIFEAIPWNMPIKQQAGMRTGAQIDNQYIPQTLLS